MCGIAGSFSDSPTQSAQSAVEEMIRDLTRRGPDHTDIQRLDQPSGPSVIFGHNRLSIIDLTPDGNQPMWDRDRRLCITYNGEIYNYLELRRDLVALGHEFTTHSDTEVILEAFKEWGIDCLNRLNGMFAFALFDTNDGRLRLVRDRFGVKPLYYAVSGSRLLFSSTPGPLARQLNLRPNLGYVSRGVHYLLFEDDGPIAPYEGVDAVPSGHYASITCSADGRVEVDVASYYNFESRVLDLREDLRSSSDEVLVGQLASLLDSAATIRLRADVPVAISLSGGLDSSSIAAIVAQAHPDITGYSFGRPDISESEGPLTALVVAQTNIGVQYVWPSSSEMVAGFWETLEAQDAPFTELSMVAQYLVCKAAHASGIKVLLGGQGGDEMLMGYRKFQVMLLLDAVRRRDARAILRYAGSLAPMLAAESRRAPMYLRQRRRYTEREGLSTALRLPRAAALDMRPARDQPAVYRQVLDVTRLSLPTLLRYEDRSSMANSLETRLPFLDYRLAEFAVALPDRLKVRAGYGKWALRAAMQGRVPASIRTARYKRGFDVVQSGWMKAGLGQSIRDRLNAQKAATEQWLSRTAQIDQLFSDQRLATSAAALAEATSLLWLALRT